MNVPRETTLETAGIYAASCGLDETHRTRSEAPGGSRERVESGNASFTADCAKRDAQDVSGLVSGGRWFVPRIKGLSVCPETHADAGFATAAKRITRPQPVRLLMGGTRRSVPLVGSRDPGGQVKGGPGGGRAPGPI